MELTVRKYSFFVIPTLFCNFRDDYLNTEIPICSVVLQEAHLSTYKHGWSAYINIGPRLKSGPMVLSWLQYVWS